MKPRLQIVVVAVLCGVAFALGRWGQPARIETVEVETVRYVETVRTLVRTERVEAKHVHREETRAPDGTVRVVEDSRSHVAENTHATSDTARAGSIDTARQSVTTNDRPDWHVSALVGLPGPVYGAHVQRRILGPVSVGAWALTSKAAGVSLGVEF